MEIVSLLVCIVPICLDGFRFFLYSLAISLAEPFLLRVSYISFLARFPLSLPIGNMAMMMVHFRCFCGFLIMVGFASFIRVDLAYPQQNPSVTIEKDHAEKMTRGAAIFKSHLRDVFIKQCLSCHGGEKTESEFDLTDREKLFKGGLAGVAINPKDAKKSLLFRMINHQKKPYMPLEGEKLPEKTIQIIAEWIELGAPYDRPLIEKKQVLAWQTKQIPVDAKNHWAFQPFHPINPPTVHNEKWVKTPIDRFILQRLEHKGLIPNPQAAKEKLIRRLYLDLIGLPPTPEEIDSFLNDFSPEAYEKRVDLLLSSQHFGERWGRHWLDLTRFAESHGFEHDYDRPSAYHYRDFVIQTLNADLPYDTFVKWQLAGDEIAPQNRLALMATGFLSAGVHSTQITANEVEKHRYDELDDILSTTGTAFLGLTIGCARCHDHKYDPIPSGDYYRLLSTFTTTVRSELEMDFDPEGYRKANQQFEIELQPFLQSLKQFEKDQLPKRFAEWERKRTGELSTNQWIVPEIVSTKSKGGATLEPQSDGGIFVSGKNPDQEELTFVFKTELREVRQIRIEALTHPTLVKNGPGRATNGNFALTDFKLEIAAKQGDKPTPIKLKNPQTTFEQKGLGIAGAIDDSPSTAWAIDPQFGKDHAASFELEKPIGFEGGSFITITMKFLNNVGHGMGRPRISVSNTKENLDLKASSMSGSIVQLLRIPPENRSANQTQKLLDWYRHLDPAWNQLNTEVQRHLKKAPKPDLRKVLVSSEGLPPLRLHTQGADFFKETYYLKRGDPNQKEGVAQPGYLQVLFRSKDATTWKKEPAKDSRLSLRRTAFADWITDVERGAGNLLARVMVNRIWQHYLGRGIVATPSDFGLRGERPTHPELLNYLANQLVENQWKLKSIHKSIVMSSVYQQTAQQEEAKSKVDPENRFLWRFPIRRLEGEIIRDSLLSVSNQLDPKMFGPGTLDENSRRRSIYFTMKRSRLIPSLIIFDAPDGNVGIGDRPSTTIAPQALHLLNNPHVRSYARLLADRLLEKSQDPKEIIRKAYRITFARFPSPDELSDGISFIQNQTDIYQKKSKSNPRLDAYTDFCQVLFCLNEFVYVD